MTDSFERASARILQRIGSSATFTPATGDPIAGIYVNHVQESAVQSGIDAGMVRLETTIEYLLSDIGRRAASGETFTIGSTVYTVYEQVSNDGYTAMVTVR